MYDMQLALDSHGTKPKCEAGTLNSVLYRALLYKPGGRFDVSLGIDARRSPESQHEAWTACGYSEAPATSEIMHRMVLAATARYEESRILDRLLAARGITRTAPWHTEPVHTEPWWHTEPWHAGPWHPGV